MRERRESRRVERSAGVGTITRDGTILGTVSYVLEIWQTFHIVQTFGPSPAQEIPGMQEIHIQFVRHELDTFALWQQNATLTLQLQDGRRLDGFLDGNKFVASGQMTTV